MRSLFVFVFQSAGRSHFVLVFKGGPLAPFQNAVMHADEFENRPRAGIAEAGLGQPQDPRITSGPILKTRGDVGKEHADGLLETIEVSSLGAGPAGQSAEEDFFSEALSSCGVASLAWSMAIAFDRQAFAKAQPTQIADLLDTKKFPGKRALPHSARYTLELALLADGVDPARPLSGAIPLAG